MQGRENTVYLFGSVHLLPEGGFTIGGALAEALDEAERVCLELDPDAETDAEKASLTLARAIDPDGRGLFDLLGDDADRVQRERSQPPASTSRHSPHSSPGSPGSPCR